MSRPLGKLRLHLTAWHVATFGIILALLGGGLFLAIRRQFTAQLDASLRAAAMELVGAARIREMEAGAPGRVIDAVDELHVPDRTLYLVGIDGRPVKPDTASGWIRDAARSAATAGTLDLEHELGTDATMRLHARRFRLASGAPMVAIAVADRIELEDRYAALIGAFGAAALFALVLVAGGSWFLVRKSTAPIERSFAYMRRFMADAAHELRSPITVIQSRAEVTLQQPRDAATYHAAIEGIRAETTRLGRIVEQLLTLARADSGELPLERRRVFLDDVTLDAAGTAKVIAEARGIALEVDEFEEAVVQGDAGYLRQLVMILLDNAVKFTPSGGTVSVRVGAEAGRARLVVKDTGIGIAVDQQPRVFERFFRADASRPRESGTRGESGGAGLGLAIARWITDAHGAEIAVSSIPGSGTTVTVLFPAAPSTAES